MIIWHLAMLRERSENRALAVCSFGISNVVVLDWAYKLFVAPGPGMNGAFYGVSLWDFYYCFLNQSCFRRAKGASTRIRDVDFSNGTSLFRLTPHWEDKGLSAIASANDLFIGRARSTCSARQVGYRNSPWLLEKGNFGKSSSSFSRSSSSLVIEASGL